MNTHAQHEHTWFTTCLANTPLIDTLKNIRLVITDVDGCLTNCTKSLGSDGTHAKNFHMRDGLGLSILQHAGIPVALVSGDPSPSTQFRAQKLRIPQNLCRFVAWDKKEAEVKNIQAQFSCTPKQTMIIGDDISDSMLLPQTLLFACPSDAPFYIQKHAALVSPLPGGSGAIRPLIDLLLFVQKKHPQQELVAGAL